MEKTNFAETNEISINKMQKINGGHAFWGCSTNQGKILGALDDLTGGAITKMLSLCQKFKTEFEYHSSK